jgi:hypothetical protein
MGYSGAWGKLLHEKNFELKILCQTPFKASLKNLTISFSLSRYINLYCTQCPAISRYCPFKHIFVSLLQGFRSGSGSGSAWIRTGKNDPQK